VTLPLRGFLCQDDAGTVHMDSLVFGFQGSGGNGPLLCNRCALISFSRCVFWSGGGSITSQDSTVVANGTAFREGPSYCCLFVPRGTLLLWNSHTWLIDCTAIGTDGGFRTMNGGPGIAMCQGTLHLGGSSYAAGGYPYQQGFQSGAVEVDTDFSCSGTNNAVLYLDPRVQTSGGIYINTVHNDPVTGLTWNLDSAHTILATTFWTHPGSLAVLATAPVSPTPFPTVVGPVFLDPSMVIVLGLGISNANGVYSQSIPVVPAPPLGMTVGLQAVELTTAGEVFVSNVVAPGAY